MNTFLAVYSILATWVFLGFLYSSYSRLPFPHPKTHFPAVCWTLLMIGPLGFFLTFLAEFLEQRSKNWE